MGRRNELEDLQSTLDEFKELRVGKIATQDAILFCWATTPLMGDAHEAIAAWGFKVRTAWIWVKLPGPPGMGFYGRVDHEHLLKKRDGNVPLFLFGTLLGHSLRKINDNTYTY